MLNKIIFFDIDQTLFDKNSLMNSFYEILISKYEFLNSDIQIVENIYEETKIEIGSFSPSVFLRKLYKHFPNLNSKLDYFFEPGNIKNYLYEDSQILFDLKGVEIGLFSKGEFDYQKSKVESFLDIVGENNLYIFDDKEEKISVVFSKYSKKKIYLVDDNLEILSKTKEFNNTIITILIDREKLGSKNDRIDFVIESLFDIIPVLNEKIT